MTSTCPFCTLPPSRILENNTHGLVIRDGFPVSPGHTLVVPKRHIGSFFELEVSERDDLLKLLDHAKAQIQSEFKPDGYNIGINDGPASGQPFAQLDIHLIPRYSGYVPDPRGGVRRVLPDKAQYWP